MKASNSKIISSVERLDIKVHIVSINIIIIKTISKKRNPKAKKLVQNEFQKQSLVLEVLHPLTMTRTRLLNYVRAPKQYQRKKALRMSFEFLFYS